MNQTIETFARDSLKKGLSKCEPSELNVFARMYGTPGIDETVDEIVDKMSSDKLDWALTQVENTLKS